MHGPTFMGNPIACAAANASLDLFDEEPCLKQVAAIEAVLRKQLEPLTESNNVECVNCLGAVGAVRMKAELDVSKAVASFVAQGVWIRPIRDTVYLAPAFTISEIETRLLCDAIEAWADAQKSCFGLAESCSSGASSIRSQLLASRFGTGCEHTRSCVGM